MVEIESSNTGLYYHMTAEEWKEKVRKMNLWPWKQEAIIDPEIELLHKDGLYFLPKGKVLLVDSKIIGARCYICQCGWWGNHHKTASLGLGTEVGFCQSCWEGNKAGNINMPSTLAGTMKPPYKSGGKEQCLD